MKKPHGCILLQFYTTIWIISNKHVDIDVGKKKKMSSKAHDTVF